MILFADLFFLRYFSTDFLPLKFGFFFTLDHHESLFPEALGRRGHPLGVRRHRIPDVVSPDVESRRYYFKKKLDLSIYFAFPRERRDGGGGKYGSRRKIQVFVVENSCLEGELNQDSAEC